MKVRGGMYCEDCLRAVAAQKSTHRLRNITAGLTAPITGGLSLAGAKAGRWHCPHCGGSRLIPVRAVERARRELAQKAQASEPAPTAGRDYDMHDFWGV